MTGHQIVESLMRQGLSEPRELPPLKRLRASGVQVIERQKRAVREMVAKGIPKPLAIRKAQRQSKWWRSRKERRQRE